PGPEPRRCDEPPGCEAPSFEAVGERAVVALRAELRHPVLVHAVVAGDTEERPAFAEERGARERSGEALLPTGVDDAGRRTEPERARRRAARIEHAGERRRDADERDRLPRALEVREPAEEAFHVDAVVADQPLDARAERLADPRAHPDERRLGTERRRRHETEIRQPEAVGDDEALESGERRGAVECERRHEMVPARGGVRRAARLEDGFGSAAREVDVPEG